MEFGFKKVSEINANNSNVAGNYGKFGLNEATLSKFDYVAYGGKDPNVQQDALDVSFKVGEKDFNHRIFPARVFGNTDVNSASYKEELAKSQDQVISSISQIVEAIVPSATIEQALAATKPSSFKDYVELMARLIKGVANWDKKPLHLFLNWQAKPSENQQKTYLEVPRQNILKFNNSIYVTSKLEGTWTEDRTDDKLVYKNASGEKHPISRDKWFMTQTAYAKRIDLTSNTTGQSTSGEFSDAATPVEEREDW